MRLDQNQEQRYIYIRLAQDMNEERTESDEINCISLYSFSSSFLFFLWYSSLYSSSPSTPTSASCRIIMYTLKPSCSSFPSCLLSLLISPPSSSSSSSSSSTSIRISGYQDINPQDYQNKKARAGRCTPLLHYSTTPPIHMFNVRTRYSVRGIMYDEQASK